MRKQRRRLFKLDEVILIQGLAEIERARGRFVIIIIISRIFAPRDSSIPAEGDGGVCF